MTSWVTLSKVDHINHYWKPRAGFGYAANLQVVEISIKELNTLIPNYVVGYIESESGFRLVALLGLGGAQNLYVNSRKQWLCGVQPRNIASYPFVLLPQESTGDKILCINEENLTEEESDRRIFKKDGTPTAEIAGILKILFEHDQDIEMTRKACDLIADADLLESWPIRIEIGKENEAKTLTGLYRINEKALATISDECLSEIHQSGGLAGIYGHLFSTEVLNHLGKRIELLGKEYIDNSDSEANIEELFGDQGSLSFASLDD